MVRGRWSTMLRSVEAPRTKNWGRPMRSDSALRQARSWVSRRSWSGVSEAVGSEGVGRVRWNSVGMDEERTPGAKAPLFSVAERPKPEGLGYLEASRVAAFGIAESRAAVRARGLVPRARGLAREAREPERLRERVGAVAGSEGVEGRTTP